MSLSQPRRVTVATTMYAHEAHLIRLRLEAAGIGAELMDEAITTAQPFLSSAVGGVKVQVDTVDAERARTLLALPPAEAGDVRAAEDEPAHAEADRHTVVRWAGTFWGAFCIVLGFLLLLVLFFGCMPSRSIFAPLTTMHTLSPDGDPHGL